MNLFVEKIITGPFQENTYIIWYEGSSDSIIIDPGDDEFLIIDMLKNKALKPLAIVNTHAHLDHIGAVSALKKKYSIPFYLHKNEKFILDSYEESCAMFGLPARETPTVDIWIKNNKQIQINNFEIDLILTPGHTPGGICIKLENHLFVGDTLFRDSIGRTDLPGGDHDTLETSLFKIFKSLDHKMITHSGHGIDSTLIHELNNNPFLFSFKKRLNL